MSQLDAIAATRSVKERLLDFCRSDHYVTDPELDRICQSIWSSDPQSGGLAGDLWVEAAFPPRGCGRTMREHVDSGLVNTGLAELLDLNGAFRMNWELREIQSRSIEAARAADGRARKPAIVVSAGTGAGKTESFLFPLLDELTRNPRKPHGGISAIILYPMNALVTDQVERLTNWLKGQTKLRIFHFTGETPEDHQRANNTGYPKVADCCFRTRQQARGLEDGNGRSLSETERGDQPDVLVTNYSMLEYMLCRPQDAVFFGENLRHIVLDEAHLYTGNLAAEITLLLRRVAIKSRVEVSAITHYATSATLVEGEVLQQEAALRRFASRVFSKPEDEVAVILGQRAKPSVEAPESLEPTPCPVNLGTWPSLSGIEEIGGADQLVASSEEEWEQWINSLAELLPKLETRWNEPREICRFLYRKLPSESVFRRLYHLLYEHRIQPLEELARSLWGKSDSMAQEATRRLLQAGAIARPDATHNPLLPNRIHWSVRAPNGLFFSFAHEHAPSQDQVYRIDGKAVGYFYSPGFFSRPEEDKTFPLLVMRDASRGEWLLAGIEQGARLMAGEEALPKSKERLEALLERLSFFRLDEVGNFEGTVLDFDPLSGKVGEPGGVRLRKLALSERQIESMRPMGSDSRLQLSVIAEGALAELPPYPGDSKRWKPAEGRRLLIFSDSRSEAATLGPSLTGNHERQLFRALVVEGLDQLAKVDGEDTARKIAELEQTLAIVPEVARGAIQEAIEKLENEREAATEGLGPADFAEKLKSCQRVQEFFDRKEGERHEVSKWSQQLFERNRSKIRETLSHRLSQELARKTLWPDLNLESAGVLELVFPKLETIRLPKAYLGQLPRAELRERLDEHFPAFVGMVLDHIRDLGGVTLGSDEENASYGIGGGYIGKWISLESRFKNSLLPLITTRDDSLVGEFTKLFLRESGMSDEEATTGWRGFLENVFEQLYEASRRGSIDWLEFDQRQAEENRMAMALRLRFNQLRIRRPLALFQCADTGQVWPRSALGCHLRGGRPSLVPITREQLAQNPRIARVDREWSRSKTFQMGLWAEEHSAQIGASENRRLQDLFKAGIRNVLSSTTTLELGIDIGGLNGVMMGNLPPGKASYLQRAGRAGRRADGSSLVLSYARNSPYERKVFEDFGRYIGSPLREPWVFLDRADLVRRHVHSLLFGEFFSQAYGRGTTRGAMEAFGRMGRFTNVSQTAYWDRGGRKPNADKLAVHADLDEHFPWAKSGDSLAEFFDTYLETNAGSVPPDLAERIRVLTRDTGLAAETAEEFRELISGLRVRIRRRIEAWREDYHRLLQQWLDIPADADTSHRNLANALHYQLKQLYGMTLIEVFSDAMILPRYGFPIGLSELKVNPGKSKRDTEGQSLSEAYRLNRSASQAVQEYAPGSKNLAGARIVHSQGILKSWTGDDIPSEGMGLRAWYRWNERTGEFRYQYDRFAETDEPAKTDYSKQGEMIFVKHGFTTAAWDKPTYGGSPSRVGTILSICRPPEEAESSRSFESFFGIAGVKARLHVGGELLAMNSGDYEQGFAVCTKCGYSRSEVTSSQGGKNTGREGLPKGFDWHAPIHDEDERKNCWKKDETFVLRHLHLAARQVCDFLEIELPHVPGSSTDRRTLANTVSQALRLSGARLLNIDARELSLLRPTSGDLTRISICDSLAGGAGHVRDLSNMADEWWASATEMIETGTPTQAMLELLTADVPSRDGLPDLSIESAREYLRQLKGGWTKKSSPDCGDQDNNEVFDFSKHFKKPH